MLRNLGAFIFLLKDQKNVIEKLTSTGTFSKKK